MTDLVRRTLAPRVRSAGALRRRGAVLALVFTVGAGCGLAPETAPQRVTDAPTPADVPVSPATTDVVPIFLVRADRLVPVYRAGRTADDALALLARGPSAIDGESGLGASLPPHAVRRVARQEPAVVTVEVTPEVATLSGRAQLLAVAQLVWTTTGVCCDMRVRVVVDGKPILVLTDGGTVERSVGRDDYRSVAPG